MHTTEQLNTALDGRYVIERRIGAGGMAVVYLARDLKHQRLVALKVLNPELGAVLGVERFMSEIQVMATSITQTCFHSSTRAKRAVCFFMRCRSSKAKRCASDSCASDSSASTTRFASRRPLRARSTTRIDTM